MPGGARDDPPVRPYTAGDGKVVMMAIQNEREWRGFCARFLERPELAAHPHYATNADRNAHREELGALIAARFAELTGTRRSNCSARCRSPTRG